MGLFDTIEGKFFCPFCGAKVEDFQTKDLNPMLNVYRFTRSGKHSFREEIEMHTSCEKCKQWVSLKIPKSKLKLIRGAIPREI